MKDVKQKVAASKSIILKDSQILWALRSLVCTGDVDCATALLLAMSDSAEGLVTPFNPDVVLQGAVNRQAVTCYLDATLFAIFSKLDSFEAMLYNEFSDVPRQKLAFLLRLWVNLLRTGKLITTDITKEIQASLAECGWASAKELEQQDASEAFTFITEKLNLPLLTLKMDIFHNGRQDTDDHKFINERILEVGIPTLPQGQLPDEIKLEDCLEEYFNNRIEVRRYLERRNTLSSVRTQSKGAEAVHIESVEVSSDTSSPVTPVSRDGSGWTPLARPSNRYRAPSIIQERYIPSDPEKAALQNEMRTSAGRTRAGSVRKEVLMPAWQFFSLIPWYTDSQTPSTNAQVAAHFSLKRPVLGLCLKRYAYNSDGQSVKLKTRIDIPVEIGLPHFIQDDKMDDDGPLYGNFKLSLQSVVCHRGDSVNAGHYIALVRNEVSTRNNLDGSMSHWLRFDDLAATRVTLCDVQQALREETPYLLFYQVIPVDGDPGSLMVEEAPPPYAESIATESTVTDATTVSPALRATGVVDSYPSSSRQSFDIRNDTLADFTQGQISGTTSILDYATPIPAMEDHRHEAASETQDDGFRNNNLSKTISKLSGRGREASRDKALFVPSASTPQIHVDEAPAVSMSTTTDKNRVSFEQTRSKDEAPAGTYSSTGPSRSRSKRDKSRSRLLRSKEKSSNPDRECNVM